MPVPEAGTAGDREFPPPHLQQILVAHQPVVHVSCTTPPQKIDEAEFISFAIKAKYIANQRLPAELFDVPFDDSFDDNVVTKGSARTRTLRAGLDKHEQLR